MRRQRRRTARWGRARRRAVDPIIATILMVAVTVVLAALLYVLIVGLARGPGSPSIGGAFSVGHPIAGTCAAGSSQTIGAAAISGGCTPGDYIYTLSVESSSLTFGSVLFEVRTQGGSVYAQAGPNASFAILTSGSQVASVSVTGAHMGMTASWARYGLTSTSPSFSGSSQLTSAFTLVIDMGSPTSVANDGLTFVALGYGNYQGSTAPVTLP
jgi:flagellin-like protein